MLTVYLAKDIYFGASIVRNEDNVFLITKNAKRNDDALHLIRSIPSILLLLKVF